MQARAWQPVYEHTLINAYKNAHTQALLYCAKTVPMPHNGQPTQIRVGIHTGPVVTGLIGTKLPKYGVFGDTM